MKCKLFLFVPLWAFIFCQSTPIIISINDRVIDQKDVNYRLAIDRAYGNDQSGETEVIVQLIMQELREIIAEQEGIYITDSMITHEALRIDKETKAPKTLTKVKAVFANYNDYLRHYVRPVLVERLLQEEFLFDTLYQMEPYRIINKALAQSVSKRFDPDSSLRVIEPSDKQLQYYENYADNGIGEDKYSYFFLKRTGGKKAVYLVPKMDYTKWLHTEALKVPVRVYNEELRVRLLDRTRSSEFWQTILSK